MVSQQFYNNRKDLVDIVYTKNTETKKVSEKRALNQIQVFAIRQSVLMAMKDTSFISKKDSIDKKSFELIVKKISKKVVDVSKYYGKWKGNKYNLVCRVVINKKKLREELDVLITPKLIRKDLKNDTNKYNTVKELLKFEKEESKLHRLKIMLGGVKRNIQKEINYYTRLERLNQESKINNIDSVYITGLKLFENEKYLEALDTFRYIVNIDSNYNTGVYFYMGEVFRIQKKYLLAIKEYNKVININPNHSESYNNKGYSYFFLENYSLAMENFTEAININPKFGIAYCNRGILNEILGNNLLAVRDYTNSININKKYWEAYYLRAHIYIKQELFSQAIRNFNNALEFAPDDYKLYYDRGYAYRKNGDYDNAIKDFTRAININQKKGYIFFNRGIAYAMQKDYTNAIKDHIEAIHLNPFFDNAYNLIGNYFFSINGFIKASIYADMACELGDCKLKEVLKENKKYRN